jgi:hypothetical protein
MTAIATAIEPPPLSSRVRRREGVTGGKRMRDSRA